MSWVKIDDGLPTHPKLLKLPPAVKWLFIEGLCYANKHLTDGHLPDAFWLPNGSKTATVRRRMGKLVDAGLLTETATGWQIHDYLRYQFSRAQVERRRELTARRVRDWRQKKRKRNGVTKTGERGDVTQGVTPPPTRPPSKEGEGRGGGPRKAPPAPLPKDLTSEQYRRLLSERARRAQEESDGLQD